MDSRSRALTRLGVIGLALFGAALTWWLGIGAGASSRGSAGPAPSTAPSRPSARPPSIAPLPDHAPPSPRPPSGAPPSSRVAPAGLDLASIDDPDERAAVTEVAAAIDLGTATHYRKDDAIWQNREHRLPARPGGYYREYTVDTPGESDRGARRIIAGRHRELFYTRDHYRSFAPIREAAVP